MYVMYNEKGIGSFDSKSATGARSFGSPNGNLGVQDRKLGAPKLGTMKIMYIWKGMMKIMEMMYNEKDIGSSIASLPLGPAQDFCEPQTEMLGSPR